MIIHSCVSNLSPSLLFVVIKAQGCRFFSDQDLQIIWLK